MTRTQVQLQDEQLDSLRQAAAESGKSIAELVRLGVQLYLDSQHEPSPLLQSHLGLPAMQIFQQDVVPLLTVDWITDNRHQAGVDAALTAGRRKLSLVDCISFQTMRKYSLESAFCFDKHFREQGF